MIRTPAALKIAAAIAVASILLPPPATAGAWPLCDEAKGAPRCVVDGDTIHWHGERVRPAKTDAPEIEHAACPAERAAGERARDRLAALLDGARIRLTGHRDRYGRALGRAKAPGIGDVESAMLAEGVTLPYRAGLRAQRVKYWCGSKVDQVEIK
jgi:endonuclease YncB( thermonuclease family)